MKLLNKISIYYILNTVILFIVGLFAIYFTVNWVISDSTNGQLRDASQEVVNKLRNGINTEYSPLIEINKVSSENLIKPSFSDTNIYSAFEKEYISFRQYVTYKKINDVNYKIVVRTSLVEKEDLFSSVLIILIVILTLLLLALFFINRNTTKKIFKSFYNNLKKLEEFSLQKDYSLALEKSDINEFSELNDALSNLAGKAIKEYRLLKEFTEDLSHELQTPVAVIKSKIELLLQNEFTDSEIGANLKSIYNNIDRLDKLNRSLVLLSKLETKDLFPSNNILLGEKLEKTLDDFIDIVQSKNIDLNSNIKSGCRIEMNNELADILLSNLFSNSIKHNYTGGKIFVELNNYNLVIKNTGKEPKQDTSKYFNRFSCDEKSQNSLGLGLAICKKICDLYGIEIDYQFNNPYHKISLDFIPVA